MRRRAAMPAAADGTGKVSGAHAAVPDRSRARVESARRCRRGLRRQAAADVEIGQAGAAALLQSPRRCSIAVSARGSCEDQPWSAALGGGCFIASEITIDRYWQPKLRQCLLR